MEQVSDFLHRRSLTIGLAISICLIISCGGNTPSPADRTDTFCYNDPDGIASLDPALANTRSTIWATGHLFNGLVEISSAQLITPGLASRWTVDQSGLEWTFTLRGDVWFHSDPCFGKRGTRRVVAADVQYSIERICDARTKSTGFWAFRKTIVGAEDFFKRTQEGKSGHITGIMVDNDSVVRIRLTKPFAPFLAILTMPYGFVVPREATQTYGKNFGRHPVGTGPFMFTSWKADVEMLLKSNPQYFKTDSIGRRLPYLKTVQVTFLRDPRNEFIEFTRGHYDMISSVDGSFAPTIFEADGRLKPPYDRYAVHRSPGLSVEYYGILQDSSLAAGRSSPLTTNRLLRQALNYAIDRHRIVTYLLNGRGIPARYGVLPPTMPGFTDTVRGYTYDPDRARRLLASAGFPNGKGLPPLLLQLGNSQRTAVVAEAVQAMWKEIGVHVELRLVDFPQHLSMVRAGELAMWRTSWIGDYPDPENFLALFISPNIAPYGPNTTRISRRDLDSLYTLALTPTLSAPQRAALYNQMETIVLEESPWIFLYYDGILRLTQRNVRGYAVDASDRLPLERVFKVQR